MRWVRGYLRRDGTYVDPHFRSNSPFGKDAEFAAFAAILYAFGLVVYSVWMVFLGILWIIGYLACALADGVKWIVGQFGQRVSLVWGQIRDPLKHVLESVFAWLSSVRYDLTGDPRRSGNPLALTAKLVAIVTVLFFLFAVVYRLGNWLTSLIFLL